jgi:hypothetical protein
MANDTERMSWSYSSTISTLPRKNMQTALCHEIMRRGSYEELSNNTGLIYIVRGLDTTFGSKIALYCV